VLKKSMENNEVSYGNGELASVLARLDKIGQDISELREHQQLNGEVMLEVAKFFELLLKTGDAQTGATLRAIQDAEINTQDLVMQSTNDIVKLLVKLFTDSHQSLQQQFHMLKQLGNAAVRKIPVTSAPIRSVFLVHAIESWDALADVYEAMLDDPRFDPIVATINRHFPGDSSYGGVEKTSEALTAMGVRHLRLGMQDSYEALDILRALQPEIIFRQSHWEGDVPPGFRTQEIGFARICAIPYGMSIVQYFSSGEAGLEGGRLSSWAFDQPYHRVAWRIFCETEQTREYFKSFLHSDPGKLVLTGFPKLHRLQKAIGQGRWPIADGNKRAFRVIWAPHYSVGNSWLGFGVFHQIYAQMLNWAKSDPDTQFVLKPHPALFNFVKSEGVVPSDALEAFRKQWDELPNCATYEGPYAELFDASDILITDGLSFLTEYQLFGKPLVFFDSKRHVPLNALGKMALACAHHVYSFDEFRAVTEEYRNGRPLGFEKERQLLLKTLLPSEVPPVKIILDDIAEGCREFGRTGQREISPTQSQANDGPDMAQSDEQVVRIYA